MEHQPYTLFVHFINGHSIKFEFEPAHPDSPNIATHVEKMLNAQNLCLEVEGRLVVVPVYNIKYLELAPAPSKLPPTILKNAKVRG
jgi:hypothetical protein